MWNETMSKLIACFLLTTEIAQAYFCYQQCNPTCIHYQAPCVVEMINPDYFTNHCTQDVETCEGMASSSIACLKPDSPVTGGEDIWPYYKKHRIIPPPKSKSDCLEWRIISLVGCGLILIYCSVKISWKLVSHLRSRQYEPSRTNNGMYEETTEPLVD